MNYVIIVVIVLVWLTGMCIYITGLTPKKYKRVIEFSKLVLNRVPFSEIIKAWRKNN